MRVEDPSNDIELHFTPDEVMALYQAGCGYRVRVTSNEKALMSALNKLVESSLSDTVLAALHKRRPFRST